LKVFLTNAISLAGALSNAARLRKALEDLEASTTGAPRIPTRGLPEVKERIVFTDDMVPVGFMAAGLAAARSVARLAVPRFDNGQSRMNGANPLLYLGTGWLIAPGLLITNHHVVNARDEGEPIATAGDLRRQAEATTAWFDFDSETSDRAQAVVGPLLAFDEQLDYAILRVDAAGRTPLVRAVRPVPAIQAGHNIAVNIIQHPQGGPKKFAIRNNLVTASEPGELRYFTDTLAGSSGSPVMNDRWEVLALHRGSSAVDGVQFQGRNVAYVNVGTPIGTVFSDLQARYAGTLPELGI